MSSLVHPFKATAQKCRPKHQVLVLKCFPQYQKNVQEVKPESSPLAYLLYYASTRRSKLQKVGAFLEKKAASDVWRGRLGNVQVILQILTAIIIKAPRDLPLYSQSVLMVLDAVLRTNDINMVEASVPTFEAYCKNVDATLGADQAKTNRYLSVVECYTKYAAQEQIDKTRSGKDVPLSLRWRILGLKAIYAVTCSEALGVESTKQLETIMPIILENLQLEHEDILGSLQQKARSSEKQDEENARQRSNSISMTVVDSLDDTEGNTAIAVQTTADADKASEEEIRVLAVRCLKQIFSLGVGSNRGQTRIATLLTLRYIARKKPPQIITPGKERQSNWSTSLFEAIARWTPTQDRFVIVITTIETLIRSPIVESTLDRQLVLVTMVDWLLSSNVNLIGLSVMDVLLGLVQHTLLLLQLGGRDSKAPPPNLRTVTLGLYSDTKELFNQVSNTIERGRDRAGTETTPSTVRQELLFRLRKCIASLANHIYYTDQITDMMTAILARLKPSPQSEINSTAAAITDPAGATKAIANSGNLDEDPNTHSFFSFATARVTALESVKDILITATRRRTATGSNAEARARVGVQVWEGTQWLLKDEDRNVRFAYGDALLAWLRLETNKTDLLLPKDGPRKSKSKKGASEKEEARLARRAVSNASRKDLKPGRSTFLKLLHLSIYDRALDAAEHDDEILMLHLLLSTFVERSGVNAIRTGLPMIMRLQESALNNSEDLSEVGKINIASLVHGYLWTIVEKLDLEDSKAGQEINAEVSRRKRFSIWLEQIQTRLTPFDQLRNRTFKATTKPILKPGAVDSLRPFLGLPQLVDDIVTAYDSSLVTSAASPPSSPGRVFSVPTLGFGYGYGIAPGPRPSPEDQLPDKVKDEMLGSWSRELCIAAAEKEGSGSIAGSKTGASSATRNRLGINGLPGNESGSGQGSPDVGPGEGPSLGLYGGLGALQKLRRLSSTGSPDPLATSSSRESTVRLTDLKRALSANFNGVRRTSPLRRPASTSRRSTQSNGSESMVSWNDAEEYDRPDTAPPATGTATAIPDGDANDKLTQAGGPARPATATEHLPATQTFHTVHDAITLPTSTSDPRLGQDVPPVPKIPTTLKDLPGTWPQDASPQPKLDLTPHLPLQSNPNPNPNPNPLSQRVVSTSSYASSTMRGSRKEPRPASRIGAASIWSEKTGTVRKVDLTALLAGIDVGNKGGRVRPKEGEVPTATGISEGKGLSKPPY